ncbi:tripartite motif-containing protein 16-like [Pholidichthys leucotaenia]
MFQGNVCPLHNEAVTIFCCTDQQCICNACYVDGHSGHDIISAAIARAEKQADVEHQERILQRIRDREKYVNELQQRVETINLSADKAVEESEKLFREFVYQIRSQQHNEISQLKELQEKIQQDIAELKQKITEVEQLSLTENHVQFLHTYSLLSHLSDCTNIPSTNNLALQYFQGLPAAASQLRDNLQALLSGEWLKSTPTVSEVGVLVPQEEPKSRWDFLNYSQKMTPDANTAHKRVFLDADKTTASFFSRDQDYPSHPDRFTERRQVLCSEGLTGRCYWEVNLGGTVVIAVAYKDIKRTGSRKETGFGLNDKSWALKHSDGKCNFMHNGSSTQVSDCYIFTLGVYLDHSAGTLSFYHVLGETMTLLHSVQTSFTQPLHVGVWFPGEEWACAQFLDLN